MTCVFACGIMVISCAKSGSDKPPLPTWEDNGADSATLRVLVQTNQGTIFYGQNVNLALSRDSLSAKLLVRQVPTNTYGIAVFRKLYPRIIYYNCYVITSTRNFYGSGYLRLPAGAMKDTILIVY